MASVCPNLPRRLEKAGDVKSFVEAVSHWCRFIYTYYLIVIFLHLKPYIIFLNGPKFHRSNHTKRSAFVLTVAIAGRSATEISFDKKTFVCAPLITFVDVWQAFEKCRFPEFYRGIWCSLHELAFGFKQQILSNSHSHRWKRTRHTAHRVKSMVSYHVKHIRGVRWNGWRHSSLSQSIEFNNSLQLWKDGKRTERWWNMMEDLNILSCVDPST